MLHCSNSGDIQGTCQDQVSSQSVPFKTRLKIGMAPGIRKLSYTEAHSQGTGKITHKKQTCFNIIATCCRTCVITCVWLYMTYKLWLVSENSTYVCFMIVFFWSMTTDSLYNITMVSAIGNTCEQHNQQTRPVQHKSLIPKVNWLLVT